MSDKNVIETPVEKPVEKPVETPVETPVNKETTTPAPNNMQDNDPTVGQINILELPIDNQNDALNVMLGFLGLAQKRGCFAINESAKIYDCVKMFQTN